MCAFGVCVWISLRTYVVVIVDVCVGCVVVCVSVRPCVCVRVCMFRSACGYVLFCVCLGVLLWCVLLHVFRYVFECVSVCLCLRVFRLGVLMCLIESACKGRDVCVYQCCVFVSWRGRLLMWRFACGCFCLVLCV